MFTVEGVKFVQSFEAQLTEECALVDIVLPWLAECKKYKKMNFFHLLEWAKLFM